MSNLPFAFPLQTAIAYTTHSLVRHWQSGESPRGSIALATIIPCSSSYLTPHDHDYTAILVDAIPLHALGFAWKTSNFFLYYHWRNGSCGVGDSTTDKTVFWWRGSCTHSDDLSKYEPAPTFYILIAVIIIILYPILISFTFYGLWGRFLGDGE